MIKEKEKRNNHYSLDNRSIKRNKKNYTEQEARSKATYLARKLDNPGGMDFYLKTSWNLADWYIDWLLEYSLKKREPERYFAKVAKMKMLENS